MKVSIGFSPCPNDTFIFDALVNHKIDTGDLEFEVHLEDVQTLNKWALQGLLDVSKISYGVLPKVVHYYRVISSGGALGKGVGPLLISKYEVRNTKYEIQDTIYEARSTEYEDLNKEVGESTVAIPGENTTAHFLFSQAFPLAKNKVFLKFDEIEDFVLAGKGLGVIIHENRFTYQSKGLYKWADLGERWEQQTGLPIPLGGIVVKKNLPQHVVSSLNHAIQKSLAFAWQHYPTLPEYVTCHAQELDIPVMRQHIELYVNEFSYDMKEGGRNAILQMMSVLEGRPFEPVEVFV